MDAFSAHYRFGSAAFAADADLARAGLLRASGPLLGYIRDAALRVAGDAPAVTVGGAGSGKLRDVLAYNVCGVRLPDRSWHAPPRVLVNGKVLALSPKKGCASYRKSTHKEKLEGEFEALLKELRPSESMIRVTCVMLEKHWTALGANQEARASGLNAELARIERDVEHFLDRIAQTDVASVVAVYEDRIRKLETQRLAAAEKIANCGRTPRSFDQTVRTSLDFLGNPYKLWASEHLEEKRIVLKLAFADRLAYDRNKGLRTPTLALPFKVLGEISSGKCAFGHMG